MAHEGYGSRRENFDTFQYSRNRHILQSSQEVPFHCLAIVIAEETMSTTTALSCQQTGSSTTATNAFPLLRLPNEILDIIFESVFADTAAYDWRDCRHIHKNQLLYMLTKLPFTGHDKFPWLLTVSTDWCRLALRSWLKTRELYLGLDNIRDFSRLKPKIWTLFKTIELDVKFWLDEGWDIDAGFNEIFRACPNVTQVEFRGTDDLLYWDPKSPYLNQFRGLTRRSFADWMGWPPLTSEKIFGGIPWVKTLIAHKKLKRVNFIPGELCGIGYGRERDYSLDPAYPSVEMTAAIDALQSYLDVKLNERDAREDADEEDIIEGFGPFDFLQKYLRWLERLHSARIVIQLKSRVIISRLFTFTPALPFAPPHQGDNVSIHHCRRTAPDPS